MNSTTPTDVDESDRFVVPLGIDPEGYQVRPAHAKRGVLYKCPGCDEGLVLKKGQIRVHHFSHRGDSECNPETVLHKSAKALISKMISDAVARIAPKPIIMMQHPFCGQMSMTGIAYGVTGSAEEHRMPSGRILDVAIFKGNEVELGVEVYVTHRVDESKKSSLACPWIEVDAKQIMEVPLQWHCLQQSRVFPGCEDCARIATARLEPPPPPPPKVYVLPSPRNMTPYTERSIPHATTTMAEPRVKMCLERLPEVLDCIGFGGETLQLPGGGAVDPKQFSDGLRSDLAQGDSLDMCQKKALLWRTSEYLLAAKPWTKGATRAEKQKNETLVNEAIEWLTK